MVTFKTFEEIWKFSTYHALGKAVLSQSRLQGLLRKDTCHTPGISVPHRALEQAGSQRPLTCPQEEDAVVGGAAGHAVWAARTTWPSFQICSNAVPPNFAGPEPREAELGLAEHSPGNCYFNTDRSGFFLEHSLFFGEAFAGSDCVSWGNLLPRPWFEG